MLAQQQRRRESQPSIDSVRSRYRLRPNPGGMETKEHFERRSEVDGDRGRQRERERQLRRRVRERLMRERERMIREREMEMKRERERQERERNREREQELERRREMERRRELDRQRELERRRDLERQRQERERQARQKNRNGIFYTFHSTSQFSSLNEIYLNRYVEKHTMIESEIAHAWLSIIITMSDIFFNERALSHDAQRHLSGLGGELYKAVKRQLRRS